MTEIEELKKRIRELEDALEKEKKEKEKIEKEFEEHKRECSIINKLVPSFIKEELTHKTRRKLGSPAGHKAYWRKVPERFDYIKRLQIRACPECGEKLSEVQETRERIIEDIPKQALPIVTKYIIQRRFCKGCKKIIEPQVTEALPGARLGLRVMILVALLKIGMSLPEEKIVRLLKAAYHFEISPSEVVSILDQLRRAFGTHYSEIERKIREAPVKGCDETGWRLNGKNHWLWSMVNEEVAWYRIHRRRSHEVVKPALGNQKGKIIVHDRLVAYNTLSEESECDQQICWAHILRDSKKLAKNYEEAKTVHRRLKSIFKKAKKTAPNGTKNQVENLLSRIDNIGKLRFEHKSIRTFRNSICKTHRNNLFRFVTNPAVPSTNNGTERAIRKAVIIRKISGGNRSQKGARITETLLSIIETIKLQKKNPLEEMLRLLQTTN